AQMKSVSNNIARECLVCAESTRVAHLGMDLCRACAVFYRRYHSRVNRFKCRSASGKCAAGKGLNCKKCRMTHLDARLSKSEMPDKIIQASTATIATPDLPNKNQGCDQARGLLKPDLAMTDRPLLARLKTAYTSMSYARHSSEIYSRTDVPHPLRISLEEGPFIPGNFASLTLGIRILLSTSLNFGSEVFPEFAMLPDEDKWSLVVNFFYRFRSFEGCFRSNIFFPDDRGKNFMSYSSWMTEETRAEFLKSASPCGDVAGALQYMRNQNLCTCFRASRLAVGRVNPCTEEFLAIMTLMFFDEVNNGEAISVIGEKYRNEILKELHS
ncbi:hypothetical protein PENTCL1PPCAC_15601, partial [Pristionchus entomophagus]